MNKLLKYLFITNEQKDLKKENNKVNLKRDIKKDKYIRRF